MSYEVLRYIFIIAAILSGAALLATILLFIFLRIPKIIGDLSGATARKAIKQIREQNESSGDKKHKVSHFNRERGALTDKISPSGNLIRNSGQSMHVGVQTTKIATQELPVHPGTAETSVLGGSETTVLTKGTTAALTDTNVSVPPQDATSLLSYGETSVLTQPDAPAPMQGETSQLTYGETSVLQTPMPDPNKTMDLGSTGPLSRTPDIGQTASIPPVASVFEILYDITYVHSSEVIA